MNRISYFLLLQTLFFAPVAFAQDYFVYNIFKPLMMGNPGEKDYKDYYITAGSAHGIRPGSKLKVFRKIATYDQVNRTIHQEVLLPIAEIKVIHAEERTAIARLEKLQSADEAPAVQTPAVMIGDLVRLAH
jgi:hypothetical protein